MVIEEVRQDYFEWPDVALDLTAKFRSTCVPLEVLLVDESECGKGIR